MKKLLSALILLAAATGFSAQAYECPENLYFYESNASSTVFAKNQTVFTYTVDATAADVYGVIVNVDAKSWDDAQSNNGYFANGKYGDITVSGAETWSTVSEWTGSANSKWSNGCYKFAKGAKYDIKLVHANGTFTGTVSVEGESTDLPVVAGYDTTKDYYIDASACSWFFDGDAVILVWDGAQNVTCEKVTDTILKFRPTAAGTEGIAYVKRVDPKDADNVWNEYGMLAPTDKTHNMFTLNSDFTGGEWGVFSTPEAWVISKGVNNWSADAVSDYKFTYDEATGLYTVSVPADKLRAEGTDNGFKIGYGALNDWNNYYGAVIAGKVMGKGVATDAKKGGENFMIPTTATTPVTITLDVLNSKVTVEWTEDPVVDPDKPDIVDSDDVLKVSLPKMDVNGETLVEVTLQAAEGQEYCSAQWDIEVPAGFTVSDIALNKERCTDHELITNVVDGVTKCIIYSAKNTPFVRVARPLFSFKLTAANAAVGEVAGKLSNIIFNVAPVDGNLNIAHRFKDTPLNISVVKAVSKIVATPANVALATGESKAIALTIEPADASDKTVTWEVVSGQNVIDLADGTVTAKASGVATIKVTANDGFGASVTIDVTVNGKKVEKITLSATEHTMYVGENLQLTATVTPDDATNKGVMWVSSDDNVATVSSEGLVEGIGAGEATIYAIAKDGSDVQASCTVTVKAKVSGDADGDDTLSIADIVIIAKKVVGIETEGAKLENMDMDGDGNITSSDVTLAVYYLNLQPAGIPERAEMSTNMLRLTAPVPMDAESYNIPLYLDGARNVAGIQFDIVLPAGMELTENSYVAPEAANGHNMTVTPIAENTYRVVIYSANNFTANSLGYLNILNREGRYGKADFDLNNVMYSDGNDLKATDDSRTTLDIFNGVEGIFAGNADALVDVYTTAGVRVLRGADRAAVKALPAGIYVIGNQKVIVF